MTTKLKTTPSKKIAAKSHLNFERQLSGAVGVGRLAWALPAEFGEGVFDSASVCETEPTVRGLLLKTASRFMKSP
jgi:hypothetical protein